MSQRKQMKWAASRCIKREQLFVAEYRHRKEAHQQMKKTANEGEARKSNNSSKPSNNAAPICCWLSSVSTPFSAVSTGLFICRCLWLRIYCICLVSVICVCLPQMCLHAHVSIHLVRNNAEAINAFLCLLLMLLLGAAMYTRSLCRPVCAWLCRGVKSYITTFTPK